MFSSKCEIFALQIDHIYARVYAKGSGVNPRLSLIFYKNVFVSTKDINCFRIHLLINLSSYWNTTELICMQISRNIVNGPKVINRFWWESGLSPASRNHLNAFCRPFVRDACFKIVLRDSSLHERASFCSCKLLRRSDECVLFPCFNAMPDIFAVRKCCVVGLSLYPPIS